MEREKFTKSTWIWIVILLASISALFIIDLKVILRCEAISIFRENMFYIVNLISKFKSIIILFILFGLYIIAKSKWVFKIEKLNYGGITFAFNKPDKILKQNIKNFLNTKRTLFKINPNKDNFYETIASYYTVYKLIRDEMYPYDIEASSKEIYIAANEMIKTLNEFLTDYQSDYKRWYEYIIENQKEQNHDIDIGEIQKKYRHYNEMVQAFKDVNKKFIKHAKTFDINVDKWS
ncbi:MAG: hypothetical protein E7D27_11285 [Clostridium celatum]|nr:hypothetical protein [Clostridium celatum]